MRRQPIEDAEEMRILEVQLDANSLRVHGRPRANGASILVDKANVPQAAARCLGVEIADAPRS